MLKAIIFDMDGVIVDTEYLEYSAQGQFIEQIKEHQQPITKEEHSQVVGLCLNEIPAVIKKLAKSQLPLEEVQTRYFEFFQNTFQHVDFLSIFRSDINAIIHFAKAHGIKLAVASSSQLSHIENILTQCGIKQAFDVIVSGLQFERSKPDPTIYHYTCQQLGVKPQEAVAIEDSYYGMLAAKRAGLRVIGYEETRMIVDQSLADYMGKNMLEILAVLEKLHYPK